LLYSMGHFERARIELEKAVAVDPADASAHNNLGAVYGRLGRLTDEIASYRKAVELDPDYADVHHNLGLALLKQGRVEEGESEMRRSLAIDTRYGPAYLNLARSLMGRDRAAEAVDLLIEGTRLLPADADMQTFLGEAYLRLGQKDKAVAAFQSSLRLRPNQAEIRQKLKSLAGGSSVRMKPESAPSDKP